MKILIFFFLILTTIQAQHYPFEDNYILLFQVEDQGAFIVEKKVNLNILTKNRRDIVPEENALPIIDNDRKKRRRLKKERLRLKQNPNLLIDSLLRIEGTDYFNPHLYYVYGSREWIEKIGRIKIEKNWDEMQYHLGWDWDYPVEDSLKKPIYEYFNEKNKISGSNLNLPAQRVQIMKYPEEGKSFRIKNETEYEKLVDSAKNNDWKMVVESLIKNKDYIIDSCLVNNKIAAIYFTGYIDFFMKTKPCEYPMIFKDTCRIDLAYSNSSMQKAYLERMDKMNSLSKPKRKVDKPVDYFIANNKINMVLIHSFEQREGFHNIVGGVYYTEWD